MKCTKSVVVFFVIDDLITQEKIQKQIFLGGEGGGIVKVIKLAVNYRTKFRITHWLEKGLLLDNLGR